MSDEDKMPPDAMVKGALNESLRRSEAGKGSTARKVDKKKYDENYDQIDWSGVRKKRKKK